MRWSPIRGSYARQERAKNGAWSTARFVLTLVILAWALRSFVFAPFSIP
jgi:hypothetical protein